MRARYPVARRPTRRPVTSVPSTVTRTARRTGATTPGTLRQPSSATSAPERRRSRGFTSASSPRPVSARITRSGTPIWTAASPTPSACRIVTAMSAMSRWIDASTWGTARLRRRSTAPAASVTVTMRRTRPRGPCEVLSPFRLEARGAGGVRDEALTGLGIGEIPVWERSKRSPVAGTSPSGRRQPPRSGLGFDLHRVIALAPVGKRRLGLGRLHFARPVIGAHLERVLAGGRRLPLSRPKLPAVHVERLLDRGGQPRLAVVGTEFHLRDAAVPRIGPAAERQHAPL